MAKIEAKELFASFIFAVDDSPEKLLNAFRLFDMGNKNFLTQEEYSQFIELFVYLLFAQI